MAAFPTPRRQSNAEALDASQDDLLGAHPAPRRQVDQLLALPSQVVSSTPLSRYGPTNSTTEPRTRSTTLFSVLENSGGPFSAPSTAMSRQAASKPASMAATPAGQALIPARTPRTDGSTLQSAFDNMRLTSFYVRPGYGSKGHPIQIEANYFAVRAIGGKGKVVQSV